MKAIVSLALAALASLPFPPRVVAQTEPDTSSARLAASTAAPWVPARPVAPARPWETVLRLPGRIVSLPVSALGWGAERTMIYVEDNAVVPRIFAFVALTAVVGLYAAPASLGERTGWGGELLFAPSFLGQRVFGSVSGSTAGYNRERVGVALGPVRALYTSEWRAQDQFYGVGMDAPESGESNFAQRGEAIRLSLSYPFRGVDRSDLRAPEGFVLRPHQADADDPARFQLSVWAGPRVALMSHGRHHDQPSIEVAHPALGAATLHRRAEHLVYGARAALDRRAGGPHWTHGWRLNAEAERFDESVEALALKDASTGARPFTRLTALAEAGVSFGKDPRTVRIMARAVDQELDDEPGVFLLSDLAVLGGAQGLSGFEPGRFRDLDLVAGKLSYIFPLGKNLEWDWHVEAGGVFPEIDAVRLPELETSYGGHLRVRSDLGLLGMAGFDWSRESVRFRFSIGGVE